MADFVVNSYISALVVGFRIADDAVIPGHQVLSATYAVESESAGIDLREVSYDHDSDPNIGRFMNGGLSFLIAAVLDHSSLKPLFDALRARQTTEAITQLRKILSYSAATAEAFADADPKRMAQRVRTLNETLAGHIVRAQFPQPLPPPDLCLGRCNTTNDYCTREPDMLPFNPMPFFPAANDGLKTFGGIPIAVILKEFAVQ